MEIIKLFLQEEAPLSDTLTHKAYYGLCPEQVTTIIKKSPNLRNMRDNFKLSLDRSNSNVGKLSFKHRSAMAWNSLPQSVKSIFLQLLTKFLSTNQQ